MTPLTKRLEDLEAEIKEEKPGDCAWITYHYHGQDYLIPLTYKLSVEKELITSILEDIETLNFFNDLRRMIDKLESDLTNQTPNIHWKCGVGSNGTFQLISAIRSVITKHEKDLIGKED